MQKQGSSERQPVHTPGPWRVAEHCGPQMRSYSQPHGVTGTGAHRTQIICGCFGDIGGEDVALANARLIAASPNLLAALKAAAGYLRNAAIDLETGAPKKTALDTINGGLKLVEAALAAA